MKLNKSETINAPVLVSGTSGQVSYQVKILSLLHQGEHFNIYQGEDVRGTLVCLKVIRYRKENPDAFRSAEDYIMQRRMALMAEHRLLSSVHACLPEPLAMLVVENNTTEDSRLFNHLPAWNTLKYQEPILVSEYLSGEPMNMLSDKLDRFPLDRRLTILKKVAKICQNLCQQNYLLQNLHPSHILLKLRHDDNIYLTGLHHAYALKNGQIETSYPDKNVAPDKGKSPVSGDERLVVFQLGLLLYYLLTFHDPDKDGNWCNPDQNWFQSGKEKHRLEKAVKTTGAANMWLVEMVLQATEPVVELRLPDIASFIQYLHNPPQDKVSFQISQTTSAKTEVKMLQVPNWATRLKVRLELAGKPPVWTKEYPATHVLSLPSMGIGRMFCAVSASDEDCRLSWWEFQEAFILPDIHLKSLEDQPLNKFGFSWNAIPELHHIKFYVKNRQGQVIELGDFTGNQVELPPDSTPLALYEPLQVDCIPYFALPSGLVQGDIFTSRVHLLPPLPNPTYRETPEGMSLEITLAKKDAELYTDIELIHNGWPREPEAKNIQQVGKNQQKVSFLLHWDKLDLFVHHSFSFRVLVNSLGWRAGQPMALSISPPPVTHLDGQEEDPGTVSLRWTPIPHIQLDCYEIRCEGEVIGRTQESSYLLRVPLQTVLKSRNPDMIISVHAVYRKDRKELISAPSSLRFPVEDIKNVFQCEVDCQVTPFFVRLCLNFTNPEALETYSSNLLFEKINADGSKIENSLPLQSEIILEDKQVEVGRNYHYRLTLPEVHMTLVDEEVKIPPVQVQAKALRVGYEDCTWEISMAQDTALAIHGNVDIVRDGDPPQTYSFAWPEATETYTLEDKTLTPDKSYTYTLQIPFYQQPSPYRLPMGAVVTPKFQLQQNVELAYNQAVVRWTPSPVGQIAYIEIYDIAGRLIGTAQSDCITLENLEPERKYVFPLKYRYLSGRVMDGISLDFTTLSFNAPVQVINVETDSFRLRWDIPDTSLAGRVKEFVLEVSGNVGTHKLSAQTRSVQIRQLCPCSKYPWKLSATFKSGSSCTLATGEATTLKPNFTNEVEVGLVHHITWTFQPSPAIDKIEVRRDDVPILQTADNEMYDSDFKSGQDVAYQFYFVLKDGRKLFAGENKLKPLTMSDLYSALKIEPGIGTIRWDFNDLKNFKYLKYIELFANATSLYKQGSHLPLNFEDKGEIDPKLNTPVGLPSQPMNFQLAVVGIAPTVRKCKKKWVLNIRGIQCLYLEAPFGFNVTAEHCCIYFEWQQTPTEILKEIILTRAGDGLVIYHGPNQECVVTDDNEGSGLAVNRQYAYTLEMIYSNYRTRQLIEVDLGKPFDASRLDITPQLVGNNLEIRWNPNVTTSITHIGCTVASRWLGKSLLLSKMLGFANWVELAEGCISVPVSSSAPIEYQIFYQDCYSHIISTSPQILALPGNAVNQ